MARRARRLRRLVRRLAIFRNSLAYPLVGTEIADTLVVDVGKPLVVG